MTIDIRKTRQRFGGDVCRVMGAVWFYLNLKELYLVQLFALCYRAVHQKLFVAQTSRFSSSYTANIIITLAHGKMNWSPSFALICFTG